MKFDVILRGNIDAVDNFSQRAAQLAEIIQVDINFIGSFLSAKESVVLSNLEFVQARQLMTKINNLGFTSEVRPTRINAKNKSKTKRSTSTKHQLSKSSTPNKSVFKTPTDTPEPKYVPIKNRKAQVSSAGQLEDIDCTESLTFAKDEDQYSSYNWSRDSKEDEIVTFKDDLVIKKGR